MNCAQIFDYFEHISLAFFFSFFFHRNALNCNLYIRISAFTCGWIILFTNDTNMKEIQKLDLFDHDLYYTIFTYHSFTPINMFG